MPLCKRIVLTVFSCLLTMLSLLPVVPSRAADEPDLIFRRSTVFKWASPNDKLGTYGLDAYLETKQINISLNPQRPGWFSRV